MGKVTLHDNCACAGDDPFPSPGSAPFDEYITGAPGQTEVTFTDLKKTSKKVKASIEGATLTLGVDYAFDASTGKITFTQSIEGQKVNIYTV